MIKKYRWIYTLPLCCSFTKITNSLLLVFLSQLPSTIDCTNTIPEYMKDFGLTQLGVIGLVISNQLRVPSLDTKVHTRSLRCMVTSPIKGRSKPTPWSPSSSTPWPTSADAVFQVVNATFTSQINGISLNNQWNQWISIGTPSKTINLCLVYLRPIQPNCRSLKLLYSSVSAKAVNLSTSLK